MMKAFEEEFNDKSGRSPANFKKMVDPEIIKRDLQEMKDSDIDPEFQLLIQMKTKDRFRGIQRVYNEKVD